MAGLSQENKFRDVFNARVVCALADRIAARWPEFDRKGFVGDIAPALEALGFLERSNLIRDALKKYLPADFPKAAEILVACLGPELDDPGATAWDGFIIWPQCAYVAECGAGHFDISMRAMYEMTKRLSAECHLRALIEQDFDRAMAELHKWTGDPSPHVRRLVSEGTRPRLPMAGRIRRFQEDPRPVIELLEKLKSDPSDYVRRSVANNMNDISKDNPEIAIATLKKWHSLPDEYARGVARHASRTLVKKGNSEIIEMLGYTTSPNVKLSKISLDPKNAIRGESVHMSFSITSLSGGPQKLVVDYALYFMKAGGVRAPKVFKLRNINLPAGEKIKIQKKISLKDTSGRKIYPGEHEVEILVSGKSMKKARFEVLPPGRSNK